MTKQILIKLDVPEQYNLNPELFPTITHARLVNIKWEVSRQHSNKIGYIEVWYAKGYIKEGIFYESTGFPGYNIVISDPIVQGIMETNTTQERLYTEIARTLSQYLIENEDIQGIIEELEVP